jgi:hypothetical protein
LAFQNRETTDVRGQTVAANIRQMPRDTLGELHVTSRGNRIAKSSFVRFVSQSEIHLGDRWVGAGLFG